MAALARVYKALHFLRSNLLMQVLFLVLFKSLLLRTNKDDSGVVDLHLGKELASTRAPNYILNHRSLCSHNVCITSAMLLSSPRAINEYC